jgi:hypothetical protein
MARWYQPKIRDRDTWDEVRRAWEGGETGASLARRYDVGLANLWRRRASEGWERGKAPDPVPEPPEGWDRYAQGKMKAFQLQRDETRAVAVKLAEAMAGGPLEAVPLWHVGFVLAWRAGHLGDETAARDREGAGRHGWTGAFWDADGRLRDLETLDAVTLEANSDAWRDDAGLPDGAAADWP